MNVFIDPMFSPSMNSSIGICTHTHTHTHTHMEHYKMIDLHMKEIVFLIDLMNIDK